jgi:hypothetical protein
MISKVLVANRAEIAIRAFRAAYELGIATVAVYPYEDRNSPHRLADEAYQIGEVSHPERAYLSVDQIVATAPVPSTVRPHHGAEPPASRRSARSWLPPRNALRHRTVPCRGIRSRAVLGGVAKGKRPLRIRHPGAHRSGVPPQDSRRPVVEPASTSYRPGLGDRFEEIKTNYAAADRVLGRLVKVTPSSKVVGDLTLALVGVGVSADEFASDPA